MGQLSFLKRYSKTGQWLELTIMSNTGENKVEGFLLELDDSAVVLKNNGRIVYQPAELIRSFVVDENKTMATIDENSSNIQHGFLATESFVAQKVTADLQVSPVSEDHVSDPETTISQDITTETVQPPTVVEPIVIESPKVQNSDNQTAIIPSNIMPLAEEIQSFPKIPAYAFVQFTNEVHLSPPEPSFIINGLNHEEQQELAKWKNKYDYAVKVHELSRIVNFLPEMIRWAIRVNSSEAYTLCGLLALKVEKFKEAREMLEKAELRPENLETVLSLSYLNIKEAKWEETAKFLLHYVLLHKEGTFDNQTFIVLLGQCLAHLENRALQGLSTIYQKVTTELQNVAALVIAFALEKSHLQAAEAAIIGHLEQAKILVSDSVIFEEVNFLPPIRQPKLPQPTFIASASPYSYGHITAIYLRDYGEFGFIIDSATKQTYYFRLSSIKDDGLYKLLQKNLVGQRVKFIPQQGGLRGKYDIAEEIVGLETAKTELPGEFPLTTSLKSPPITLPKGDSPFAKACRAEASDDLDAAERLFDKQISLGGEYQLSAVKKLAQLRSRRGYDDEAINLLDKHRSLFRKDTRTLDNLRVAILIKARHFDDAIKMFDQLLKNATTYRERITLHRQKAFCRYRQNRFDDAVQELEYVLKKSPFDNVTKNLITQVKQARDQGTLFTRKDPEETELAEWTSGLSSFAQHFLNTCDFSYVDERSKARGFYDKKDFTAVESILEQIRGKRPSEKAKVLLTLAAMCQAAPEVAGKRNLTDYLRRSLVFMGESVFNDELLHPDIARCYFTEALGLATIDGARGPLTYLLATYLQRRPAPGELQSDGNVSLETVFKLLIDDKTAWRGIQRYFPYYSVMSRSATTLLMDELKKGRLLLDNFLKSREEWEPKCDTESERLRQESNALLSLREQTYTGAGNFQNTATTLFNWSEQTLFETDKKRLKTLANIANDASSYWSEEDFIERDNKHQRLTNGVQTFSQDILKEPTKLSVERILPITDKIKEVVTDNFKDYVEKTQPTLELRSALSSDDYYNPDGNGVITIRVEIELKPGSAPIEGLSISVREMEGLKLETPASSPEPLKAGQCREVEIQVKPSPRQLEDKAFVLYTILKYLTRSGKSVEKEETIKILIGSAESFVEIQNPYKDYAGGLSVKDPNMFKGREDLLERIANIVTTGVMGQCFVLYGQKRSGKTSILKQLEKRIKPPNLAVEVTVGVLDTTTEQTNFIQLCLDAIEDWNREKTVLDLNWWPSPSQVKESPIDIFRQSLRKLNEQLHKAGWKNPRLILLVDEFTYIYEYITEGILSSSFMRMWKGLLQMQSFSAVVVGQDSMPKFKQAFANEFGVTHDERISYLSLVEAQKLAEEPILFEGKSRYRSNGRAMERLIKLTAGSPFYLQIFCDRIVRHLNERKAPFITELDIEVVKETLISGASALPIERFDPLITAAGESVAEAKREVYLNLLTAIAKHSTQSGIGVRLPDLPNFDQRERLLQDMKDRDVIVTDAEGRISIRVELFTEWLRVNHAWNQTL